MNSNDDNGGTHEVEAEEVRERATALSDDIDRILDEIEEVLEPDAEAFVRSYVQKQGNGGGQYTALAERVIDRFGVEVGLELFSFLRNRYDTPFSDDPPDRAEMHRAIAERFGIDVAKYFEGTFWNYNRITEALNYILGSSGGRRRLAAQDSEDSRQADFQESEAAKFIVEGQLTQAKSSLMAAIECDPARQSRIRGEFGFILEEFPEFNQSLTWVSGLWSILSAKSPMPLESSISMRQVSTVSLIEDEVEETTSQRSKNRTTSSSNQNTVHATPRSGTRSPQASGDALERSFLAVLTRLFLIDSNNTAIILDRLRRQQPGTQYGHDIQFDCVRADRETISCHIECKNKKGYIQPADVAEKILQTFFHWREKKLDHLIFIAPRASVSNELDLMLQSWHETKAYPFEVQIWSSDSHISELFALEPDAYHAVYGSPPPTISSDDVLERWRGRLKPIYRIPSTILTYLMEPARHCLPGTEDPDEFSELYGSHVRIRADNAIGSPVGELEKVVLAWLEEATPRSLLLLGEFGDGKSFFCYTLTRKLSDEYLEFPDFGWLSIRLSLADLPDTGDGRELLQRRLRDIGSSYADWISAGQKGRTLVILDGLDEMSVMIEPVTVANNLRLLSSCVQNLPAAKIIITSRTHIFEGRRQRDRFLEKLQGPMVLRLAPISRAKRIEHLNNFAKKAHLQDKLLKLRRLYDPIGLAAKPLFLQMIKEVLADLPDDEFSQLILYNTYVDKSLRRKIEFLEDRLLQASHDEIVHGMTAILEQVALKLHVEGRESLDLKIFVQDKRSGNLSQLLWQMTENSALDEHEEEDVRARVRIRSLLMQSDDGEADSWQVTFFHRSMREYFVARAISRALREGSDKSRRILKDAVLSPEITSFLVAMIESNHNLRKTKTRLQSHARSSVLGSGSGHLGGNTLTLLFRLPGGVSWRSWNGLELDGANLSRADLSDMDFSQSNLRQAVMNNSNLTGTDLRDCDLTGVRLEETAPVVVLEAGRSEALFLAGYGDGSIREWSTIRMDQSPDSLADPFPGLQSAAWGVDECLVILADRHVSILKEIGGVWQTISRFRMRTDISGMRINEDRVVVIREVMTPGAMGAVSVFNCITRQLMIDASTEALGPFAAVDDFAVALPLRSNKAAIEFVADDDPGRPVILPVEDVSAIALRRSEDDNLQIAAGTMNGRIFVFRVGIATSIDEYLPEWEEQVHEGAVTSICFLSDEVFVSGGVDRQVAVHEIGSAAARTVHRLQLTIRCAGVMTDGISGPVERMMFDRLRAAGRLG